MNGGAVGEGIRSAWVRIHFVIAPDALRGALPIGNSPVVMSFGVKTRVKNQREESP
jgi:hypothetical protein